MSFGTRLDYGELGIIVKKYTRKSLSSVTSQDIASPIVCGLPNYRGELNKLLYVSLPDPLSRVAIGKGSGYARLVLLATLISTSVYYINWTAFY